MSSCSPAIALASAGRERNRFRLGETVRFQIHLAGVSLNYTRDKLSTSGVLTKHQLVIPEGVFDRWDPIRMRFYRPDVTSGLQNDNPLCACYILLTTCYFVINDRILAFIILLDKHKQKSVIMRSPMKESKCFYWLSQVLLTKIAFKQSGGL